MRYRPLDARGDYAVSVPFLIDSPACVAQAALTRLLLWQGEWFANTADGTPYLQRVLGKTTQLSPDVYIKQRILTTPGVTAIVSYSTTLNGRALSLAATLDTVYGKVPLVVVL